MIKGAGFCKRFLFIYERGTSDHDIDHVFDHLVYDQKGEEKK